MRTRLILPREHLSQRLILLYTILKFSPTSLFVGCRVSPPPLPKNSTIPQLKRSYLLLLNINGLVITTSYINLLLYKASSSSYTRFYTRVYYNSSSVINFSTYTIASSLGASSFIKTSSILQLLLFIQSFSLIPSGSYI